MDGDTDSKTVAVLPPARMREKSPWKHKRNNMQYKRITYADACDTLYIR